MNESDVLWLNEGHEVWILIYGLCDGVGGIEAEVVEIRGLVGTIIASQIEAKRGITASKMQQCHLQAAVHFLSGFPFAGRVGRGDGFSSSLGVRYTATLGIATPSAKRLKQRRCIVMYIVGDGCCIKRGRRSSKYRVDDTVPETR